ncbi:MAG: hypothetical protein NTU77_01905 [Actinobacteria bacterium]|nr:hypothetical protein [Actinomycetota bacterium]
MSREDKARAAVQALIPDDEILDVALTYPRGVTKAQAVGIAAGSAIGYGSDFQGMSAMVGAYAGGKIFSNLKELPQSFVLAISPTMVYVLGRDKQSDFGGWDTLQPMIKFERRTLHVELQQTLATLNITLVDTEHDATLELESKRLGTLDVKALLELMMMSDEHLQDEAEEDARTSE